MFGDWTNFQANTYPGIGEIVAFNGAINTAVPVEVITGPVDWIEVFPDSFCMSVGETTMMSAQAYDNFGNPLQGAVYSWSLDGPGTLDSPVGDSVNFTADTLPGYTLVNVTVDDRRAMAFIGVTPGDLTSIAVSPVPSSSILRKSPPWI